jgi:N-acetylglucosaminyl-diphospho-decaprenol L-rhamnosyltransferase
VTPPVTVVVATRNRRPELLGTLGHHEAPVVVVDNASDDGTPAAVAAGYPGVEVVCLERNLGAAARNVGAICTESRYVAFADDDSYWEPGALARAAEILDLHPGTALVAATVLVGTEGRLDPVSAEMARGLLGTPPGTPGPAILGFLACAVMVRRNAFLGVGGFAPLLHQYGEEGLLAMDLAAAGWHLSYVAELRVRHFPSGSQRDPAARRRREERNRVLTHVLRRPLPQAAEVVGQALATRAGRRGLLDAARLLPAALRDRHRVPAEVESALRVLEGHGPREPSATTNWWGARQRSPVDRGSGVHRQAPRDAR